MSKTTATPPSATPSTLLYAYLRSSGMSDELVTILLEKYTHSLVTLAKALDSVAKNASVYKRADVDLEVVKSLLKTTPGEIYSMLKKSTMSKVPFINPFSLFASLGKIENGVDIANGKVSLNTALGALPIGDIAVPYKGYHHSFVMTATDVLSSNRHLHFCPDGGALRLATVAFALYGKTANKQLAVDEMKSDLPFVNFEGSITGMATPDRVIKEFTKRNGVAIRDAIKSLSGIMIPDGWSAVELLSSKINFDVFDVSRTVEVTYPYTSVVKFVGGTVIATYEGTDGKAMKLSIPPFFTTTHDTDNAKTDNMWQRIDKGNSSLLACDFYGVSSIWGVQYAQYVAIFTYCGKNFLNVVTDDLSLAKAFAIMSTGIKKADAFKPMAFCTVVAEGTDAIKWAEKMENYLFLVSVPKGKRLFRNCHFFLPNTAVLPASKTMMEQSPFYVHLVTNKFAGMMICPWSPRPALVLVLTDGLSDVGANVQYARRSAACFNAYSRAIFSTYMASLAQGENAAVDCWVAPAHLLNWAATVTLFDTMRVRSKSVMKHRELETEYGAVGPAASLTVESVARNPTLARSSPVGGFDGDDFIGDKPMSKRKAFTVATSTVASTSVAPASRGAPAFVPTGNPGPLTGASALEAMDFE